VKKAKKKAPSASASPGVWPDRPAASSSGTTVRHQLDYLAWMSETAEAVGFHPPEATNKWREAVQRAYDALVDPMVHEHGDPLPPDVPPAVRPGTWPDVPAARIQGMTVRHQLTVIRTIATLSRNQVGAHHHPEDGAKWSSRVQSARDALDHGPGHVLPESARTSPPRPTAPKPPPAAERDGAAPVRAAKRAPAKKASARKGPRDAGAKKPARRRR
jgi:hypothetical protein